MSAFGKRLELKRKAQGLSQEQIAEMVGKKHRVTISSWETGKSEPSLSDLKRLAEILKTTVGWLVDGTEEGEPASVPKGYRLIEEEKLDQLREDLIEYQRKEIARQKA